MLDLTLCEQGGQLRRLLRQDRARLLALQASFDCFAAADVAQLSHIQMRVSTCQPTRGLVMSVQQSADQTCRVKIQTTPGCAASHLDDRANDPNFAWVIDCNLLRKRKNAMHRAERLRRLRLGCLPLSLIVGTHRCGKLVFAW